MPKAQKRLPRARATLKPLPRLKLTQEARDLIRELRGLQRASDASWKYKGASKKERDTLQAERDQARDACRQRCAEIVDRIAGERPAAFRISRDDLALLAIIGIGLGKTHDEGATNAVLVELLRSAGIEIGRRTRWRMRVARRA
jgi:hypothetical protein